LANRRIPSTPPGCLPRASRLAVASRCVMAKSKRTAEDIARLIHLERAPLPPSELAKISAWLNTETRKTRRQDWMFCSVCAFFALCALFAWCALVLPPPNPASPEIFEFMPLMFFAVLVVVLYLQLRENGRCRRAFLKGFVRGVRVREPGAPKKWTMRACKETVAAVRAVAAETGMSVARSIDIVKKRDPERWRSLSEPRYYEAVRRLQKSAT
jgi:hypothetical protein